MRCDRVTGVLAGAVGDAARAERWGVRHVGSCLRCQAELARYRGLRRRLHQLRWQGPDLPADLLADVLAALEPPGAGQARHHGTPVRRRVAYGGGVVAGGALLAATVVLASSRLGGRTGRRPCQVHPSRSGADGILRSRPRGRLADRGMAIDRGQ